MEKYLGERSEPYAVSLYLGLSGYFLITAACTCKDAAAARAEPDKIRACDL